MNKTGRIPGFAAGGSVGDYSPSRSYESDPLSSKFDELISLSTQIRDNSISNTSSNEKKGGNENAPTISIVNQITVTITENGSQSSTTTQATTNNKDKEDNSDAKKQEQGKQLGEAVNQLITKALLEESRDGGLLSNTFKKK
jgi:hypothetical protein